ncbi:hypothetical protein OAU61_04555, partial [Planktomarina temperata]|nr:hypothetical protein [Planktomarina temperata]
MNQIRTGHPKVNAASGQFARDLSGREQHKLNPINPLNPADILQPADVLLDLYGEDIRARAYVTSDPLRGEQMLRPDFTVPVV